MNKGKELEKRQHEPVSKTGNPASEAEPFFKWNYKFNEETGKNEFDSLQLSNGTSLDIESLYGALKRATGTSDLAIGERILKKLHTE